MVFVHCLWGTSLQSFFYFKLQKSVISTNKFTLKYLPFISLKISNMSKNKFPNLNYFSYLRKNKSNCLTIQIKKS